MGELYKLTFPSGKCYIGITGKTATERFKGHVAHCKRGRRYAVHEAILKYGEDSVVVETLAVGEMDYLRIVERRAVGVFNTLYPNGYNLTAGGDEFNSWSEASRKKATASQKLAWAKDYERRKASTKNAVTAMRAALENPEVEEARRKSISATMTGSYKGENNHAAKLNEGDILQIRGMLKDGYGCKKIGEVFRVTPDAIRLISKKKRWAHVISEESTND
jgi:hypothetical protein